VYPDDDLPEVPEVAPEVPKVAVAQQRFLDEGREVPRVLSSAWSAETFAE
jgi:hypothetical protein